MGIFDIFSGPDADTVARRAAHDERIADIEESLRNGGVPAAIKDRLEGARSGRRPWTATLRPAELLIARSHGLKPIAAISATCWLHYGWSWTNGHSEGWNMALSRMREEALAAGANAVLDVKMRTIPLDVENSMDFTLVGTAVHVEGLPPSREPIIATVPALEFVKLLEADVVPTGIAIGAYYEWMNDWLNNTNLTWMGNIESERLSQLWEHVRQRAHQNLRTNARAQGNGVLAHLNFSEMFEREGQNKQKQYLARHIVVATTVDAKRGTTIPHEVRMVVDMHAGRSPLVGTAQHHQSYASNESEGAI
ncbi:heavy metal-binding domain-containing protein [Bradyrhizobium sp. LTSP885]|uniref:heavy metal-binding domain-containing protein n=1 Tax=Bradyrhizobium sp. LTSP885 TaxID=1619232 RepID=UPI0005CB667D|nr:heavy metal-binding domain-containing protein [Bradyrhizobium sp. LTSP885]